MKYYINTFFVIINILFVAVIVIVIYQIYVIFKTNSKLEYVHWPYISDQIDELSIKPNKKNNHCSHSDLFNNSLLKELNITVTSNNTTIIQSLDKFVTITIAPHYQMYVFLYYVDITITKT